MNLKIIANGPIMIDTADPIAVRSDGPQETKTGPVYLCRCGHSASKPFCDGAHRKAEFTGPEAELEIMNPPE